MKTLPPAYIFPGVAWVVIFIFMIIIMGLDHEKFSRVMKLS